MVKRALQVVGWLSAIWTGLRFFLNEVGYIQTARDVIAKMPAWIQFVARIAYEPLTGPIVALLCLVGFVIAGRRNIHAPRSATAHASDPTERTGQKGYLDFVRDARRAAKDMAAHLQLLASTRDGITAILANSATEHELTNARDGGDIFDRKHAVAVAMAETLRPISVKLENEAVKYADAVDLFVGSLRGWFEWAEKHEQAEELNQLSELLLTIRSSVDSTLPGTQNLRNAYERHRSMSAQHDLAFEPLVRVQDLLLRKMNETRSECAARLAQLPKSTSERAAPVVAVSSVALLAEGERGHHEARKLLDEAVPLKVDIELVDNAGTQGLLVKATNLERDLVRDARIILTDILRWDEQLNAFVTTPDIYQNEQEFRAMTLGRITIHPGIAAAQKILAVVFEHERLAVYGSTRRDQQDSYRIMTLGIWQLSYVVSGADGRRATGVACLNWADLRLPPVSWDCPPHFPPPKLISDAPTPPVILRG